MKRCRERETMFRTAQSATAVIAKYGRPEPQVLSTECEAEDLEPLRPRGEKSKSHEPAIIVNLKTAVKQSGGGRVGREDPVDKLCRPKIHLGQPARRVGVVGEGDRAP